MLPRCQFPLSVLLSPPLLLSGGQYTHALISLTYTVDEPVPPGVEFPPESLPLRRAPRAPALGSHSVGSLFPSASDVTVRHSQFTPRTGKRRRGAWSAALIDRGSSGPGAEWAGSRVIGRSSCHQQRARKGQSCVTTCPCNHYSHCKYSAY